MKAKNNPQLTTIKKNYPGNTIKKNKYVNEYENEFKFSLFKAFWNSLTRSRKERLLRKQKETIPVLQLEDLPPKNKDSIVWLGHCSFIITLYGKRVLTDPNLNSFFYLKRKIEKPCNAKDLIDIDYLCVSHIHRDHLDKETIKQLSASKGAKALLPLGVSKYIRKWNTQFKTEEAGWWQEYKTTGLKVFFLPTKHWANRGLFDINKSAWGSFLFQTKTKTIFFAADTAYANHFKDIQKKFPKIDIALMPLGAYEPAAMMLPNHMKPEQSVQAFHELKAKIFIPTHYATFTLSDDDSLDALTRAKKKFSKIKNKGKFLTPGVGEVIYF
ncbi:MBL fold metallo-hydrolase [Candidatus Woesearchaeota archaeon]|nr:MBL fold metallo-hydrolase [Candidatus Woesearchaeota archaeon]